jgi:hypothetical protein
VERLLKRLAHAALALCAAGCGAAELTGLVDLRAVAADGAPSYLYSGLGKLRFDEQHDGLRIGQLSLYLRHDLTETLQLAVDAVAYGNDDSNPIDLTEAWLEWRPWPRSAWRSRVKLGAFYPPISLENKLTGWRSPYSISWSAVNTWLGEELRTIGAEYSLDWFGTRNGGRFDFGVTAGVYAWNDPAGILIAGRGWALHDRQTTLFGRIGERGTGAIPGRTLFEEIDHRPGYYAGAEARYLDRAELRVLHYDNRGDRVSYSARIDDLAWETLFDSVGLVLTPTDRLTLIAQWLGGETYIDPFIVFEWEYDAAFLLASYEVGPHRLTLRRDWFSMQQTAGMRPFNSDSGSAWTLAYLYEFDAHWSVAAEAMQIRSTLAARSDFGLAPFERGRNLQLAVRFAF